MEISVGYTHALHHIAGLLSLVSWGWLAAYDFCICWRSSLHEHIFLCFILNTKDTVVRLFIFTLHSRGRITGDGPTNNDSG